MIGPEMHPQGSSMTTLSRAGRRPVSAVRLLALAIRRSWSATTSVEKEWIREQPSRGQCAVTALVVQDYLGGQLLRAEVEGGSHYWNRLPDGTELDLTRDQFPRFLPEKVETRSRAHALSSPDTVRRYFILARRVADAAASVSPGSD